MPTPKRSYSLAGNERLNLPAILPDAVLNRFMELVEPEPFSGCWLWMGYILPGNRGYGRFNLGGMIQMAHRVAYFLLRGPISESSELDHLCRNRSCVNPHHLEAISKQENIRRGEAGQSQAAKTHCPQGHEYTAGNTYVWRGRRDCRKCGRDPKRFL